MHDHAPDQDIAAIPGSPPDLRRLPRGCSFAPRCGLATEACRQAFPDPVYPAPGRMARCLRVPDVLPGLLESPHERQQCMSEKTKFVNDVVASIATWHGVQPPNEVALRMLGDLEKLIRDFEALRGTMRFEDEPASFEAALVEAASIGVRA